MSTNSPQRRSPVLAAVGAAIVLHALAGLALFGETALETPPALHRQAVSVRTLVDERNTPTTEAAPAAVETARPVERPPEPPRLPRKARPSVASAPPAIEAPAAAGGAVGADAASTTADADAAGAPLYPTTPPPPAILHYEARRGGEAGRATLNWQPSGDGSYRLQLEVRLGDSLLVEQLSTGGFDAAGVAPTRFTDRNRRGSVRAVNFQRENGVVSFSGPQVVHPLRAGMQDRLSWMTQLPAIVAADAERAQPSATTRLLVAGPRGDVDIWTFVASGPSADAASGAPLLLFVREPRKAYDVRIEIWLDPARHHLPVRWRLGTWPAGQPVELTLNDTFAPPR